MTSMHVVVYYLDGRGPAKMTILGMYTNREDAEAAQLDKCGGTTKAYINSCVKGTNNNVVSWICEVDVNKTIDWTLAVAGSGY